MNAGVRAALAIDLRADLERIAGGGRVGLADGWLCLWSRRAPDGPPIAAVHPCGDFLRDLQRLHDDLIADAARRAA